MPNDTKKERAKQPKKTKKKVKQAKRATTPKRSMSMAERMGWTVNTQEIALKGDLEPTTDPNPHNYELCHGYWEY